MVPGAGIRGNGELTADWGKFYHGVMEVWKLGRGDGYKHCEGTKRN